MRFVFPAVGHFEGAFAQDGYKESLGLNRRKRTMFLGHVWNVEWLLACFDGRDADVTVCRLHTGILKSVSQCRLMLLTLSLQLNRYFFGFPIISL